MSLCCHKNAEITPMHGCLGESDCHAGIMLLFKQTGTSGLAHNSWLCLCLISTSSHDESLAPTMVCSIPLKNNIKFRILTRS